MRKLPIPFEYAFHDDQADKELKRLKREKEHSHRQRSSELNNILTDLAAGNDVADHND